MIAELMWAPTLIREIPNGHYYREIKEPRVGVMIHFDGSITDRWAWRWFEHPDCRVSYNYLVLDDGSYVRIAPETAAAWHAGRCRPSAEQLHYTSANHAFYGIAAATNDRVDVTPLQTLTMAWLTRHLFERHDWPITDLWRIVGHETEAWKRGRKKDPSGGLGSNPILSVDDIRQLVPRIQP